VIGTPICHVVVDASDVGFKPDVIRTSFGQCPYMAADAGNEPDAKAASQHQDEGNPNIEPGASNPHGEQIQVGQHDVSSSGSRRQSTYSVVLLGAHNGTFEKM
jgi:hypothetical protein